MYKAYRIVAGTEQVLRNSVLPALSHRKGRSFHLFFIRKTWTFIKPLSLSGSELEVMISLNSPITQWGRDHCHVLMMRSERSSNFVQGHTASTRQSRDSNPSLLTPKLYSFHWILWLEMKRGNPSFQSRWWRLWALSHHLSPPVLSPPPSCLPKGRRVAP